MPDEITNQVEAQRHTGAAATFLNRAKLKAQQMVTQAKSDRAKTLADAHTEAQTNLAASHEQATRTLGRNLQKVLAVPGPLVILAADGIKQADVMLAPSFQIMDLLVDSATQNLYHLGVSSDPSVNQQINYTKIAGFTSGTLAKSTSRLNRLAFDPVNRQIFVSAYDGIYAVDLADNTFNQIVSLPNTMFWAIAVDPHAGKIYATSKPTDVDYHYSMNVIDYHGSIIKSVPLSDDKTARCLAVDSRSGFVFSSNPESGIWRARLDLSEMTTFAPDKHIWNMVIDSSSGLLYWNRESTLFRSMTDELNAERVFELELGYLQSFALLTLADEVDRIVLAGKALVSAAPAKAAEKVAAAHRRADQLRLGAHDRLEKAHADAERDIAAKKDAVAKERANPQEAAQAKKDQAAKNVSDKREQVVKAKEKTDAINDERLRQDREAADRIKLLAQEDLNAKRLQLQKT